MCEQVFAISDCCYEINKYLPLIDTLVSTNNKILTFSSINIRKIIEDRLVEIGFTRANAVDFLDAINSTGSVISGSFLLSVLVSVPGMPLAWKPHDIDTYCPQEFDNHTCQYCDRCPITSSRMSEFMCKHKMKDNHEGRSYPIIQIIANRTWKSDTITINEVIMSKNLDVSLKSFIFDTFDFDFCKVTYDGETLSIYDPISILKRTCTYRGDKEALKYFNLDEVIYTTNKDRMHRIYKTYTNRKEKYESRGFAVFCEFDFGDEIAEGIHTTERMTSISSEIGQLLTSGGTSISKTNINILREHWRTNINIMMDGWPSSIISLDRSYIVKQSLAMQIDSIILSNYPHSTIYMYTGSEQVSINITIKG